MGLSRTVRLLGSIYIGIVYARIAQDRSTVFKRATSAREDQQERSLDGSFCVSLQSQQLQVPGREGTACRRKAPPPQQRTSLTTAGSTSASSARSHLAIHRRHQLRLRPLPCAAKRACLGQTRTVTYRWESVQPVQLSDKVDSSSKRISWAALAL